MVQILEKFEHLWNERVQFEHTSKVKHVEEKNALYWGFLCDGDGDGSFFERHFRVRACVLRFGAGSTLQDNLKNQLATLLNHTDIWMSKDWSPMYGSFERQENAGHEMEFMIAILFPSFFP